MLLLPDKEGFRFKLQLHMRCTASIRHSKVSAIVGSVPAYTKIKQVSCAVFFPVTFSRLLSVMLLEPIN